MIAADEPLDDSFGAASPPIEVLVVTVGRGDLAPMSLAVAASDVREVFRADRTTAYPGAPDDVAGVTAVRGQIVAVLDLTARDRIGSADASRVLVVLDVNGRALALAGATPVRVVAAGLAPSAGGAAPPALRLWSGRLLPVAGRVRLLDAAHPDASDGVVLPLLDAAALIDDVIDDPDGGP